MIPRTRYATAADGTHIAYQLFGSGAVDIAFSPAFHGNIEILWEQPLVERFLSKLGSFCRVILHDRRGTGMSDRVARLPDLETRVDDLLTVLDETQSSAVTLCGGSEGGAFSALFATVHPARTASLIWYEPAARMQWASDYPWGLTTKDFVASIDAIKAGWGTEAFVEDFHTEDYPSVIGDPDYVRWVARMQRHWVTPWSAAEIFRMWNQTDVRHVLPTITAPTLLISREGNEYLEEHDFIASLIPGVERAILPGRDSSIWIGDQDGAVDAIQHFLGVERRPPELERKLATVMFTDIVDSTRHLEKIGDLAWKALLQEHNQRIREQLSRYRGIEIQTTGDGFLATFDGPARAVRCACAIADAVAELRISIRAGCHTGELEVAGSDVRGIAVHIAARVSALAGPGEVLVSRTVRDLVAGSGLRFRDRGAELLRGVSGKWELFAVQRDATDEMQ